MLRARCEGGALRCSRELEGYGTMGSRSVSIDVKELGLELRLSPFKSSPPERCSDAVLGLQLLGCRRVCALTPVCECVREDVCTCVHLCVKIKNNDKKI